MSGGRGFVLEATQVVSSSPPCHLQLRPLCLPCGTSGMTGGGEPGPCQHQPLHPKLCDEGKSAFAYVDGEGEDNPSTQRPERASPRADYRKSTSSRHQQPKLDAPPADDSKPTSQCRRTPIGLGVDFGNSTSCISCYLDGRLYTYRQFQEDVNSPYTFVLPSETWRYKTRREFCYHPNNPLICGDIRYVALWSKWGLR